MDDKLTIRFIHGMAPYQAGETATFDAEYAKKVVDGGYAVAVGQKEIMIGPGEQQSPPGRSKLKNNIKNNMSWYSYPFFPVLLKESPQAKTQGEHAEEPLEDVHMAELRAMAKKAGIKFDARTRKVDLIAMLRGEK